MYRWNRAHIPTFCAGCILYDFQADTERDMEAAIFAAVSSMLDEFETVAMLNCPTDRFGVLLNTRNVMRWFKAKEGTSLYVDGAVVGIVKVTETEPWNNKNSGNRVTSMLVHIEYDKHGEEAEDLDREELEVMW